MEREEIEAILEWMQSMREALIVTGNAIIGAESSTRDESQAASGIRRPLGWRPTGAFNPQRYLEVECQPHIADMDAAEKRLREKLESLKAQSPTP